MSNNKNLNISFNHPQQLFQTLQLLHYDVHDDMIRIEAERCGLKPSVVTFLLSEERDSHHGGRLIRHAKRRSRRSITGVEMLNSNGGGWEEEVRATPETLAARINQSHIVTQESLPLTAEQVIEISTALNLEISSIDLDMIDILHDSLPSHCFTSYHQCLTALNLLYTDLSNDEIKRQAFAANITQNTLKFIIKNSLRNHITRMSDHIDINNNDNTTNNNNIDDNIVNRERSGSSPLFARVVYTQDDFALSEVMTVDTTTDILDSDRIHQQKNQHITPSTLIQLIPDYGLCPHESQELNIIMINQLSINYGLNINDIDTELIEAMRSEHLNFTSYDELFNVMALIYSDESIDTIQHRIEQAQPALQPAIIQFVMTHTKEKLKRTRTTRRVSPIHRVIHSMTMTEPDHDMTVEEINDNSVISTQSRLIELVTYINEMNLITNTTLTMSMLRDGLKDMRMHARDVTITILQAVHSRQVRRFRGNRPFMSLRALLFAVLEMIDLTDPDSVSVNRNSLTRYSSQSVTHNHSPTSARRRIRPPPLPTSMSFSHQAENPNVRQADAGAGHHRLQTSSSSLSSLDMASLKIMARAGSNTPPVDDAVWNERFITAVKQSKLIRATKRSPRRRFQVDVPKKKRLIVSADIVRLPLPPTLSPSHSAPELSSPPPNAYQLPSDLTHSEARRLLITLNQLILFYQTHSSTPRTFNNISDLITYLQSPQCEANGGGDELDSALKSNELSVSRVSVRTLANSLAPKLQLISQTSAQAIARQGSASSATTSPVLTSQKRSPPPLPPWITPVNSSQLADVEEKEESEHELKGSCWSFLSCSSTGDMPQHARSNVMSAYEYRKTSSNDASIDETANHSVTAQSLSNQPKPKVSSSSCSIM